MTTPKEGKRRRLHVYLDESEIAQLRERAVRLSVEAGRPVSASEALRQTLADGGRLDEIERGGWCVEPFAGNVCPPGWFAVWRNEDEREPDSGPNLRAAIDAAIRCREALENGRER